MLVRKELLFSLTLDFDDYYRTNLHGTRTSKVKITLAYESLISWQDSAECTIDKNNAISWNLPEDCPLIIKATIKTLYSDEDLKEIFGKMRPCRG